MKILEMIIEEVETAIKGNEGFNIKSIFPFYLHETRIDLNQIELIDNYCDTNFTDYIKSNGWKLDVNRSLWSLYTPKSEASRALKALDKQNKVCLICGKEFIASANAKFCSNACRQKNKYSNSKLK